MKKCDKIKFFFVLLVTLSASLLQLAACDSGEQADAPETDAAVETLAAADAVSLDGYVIMRADMAEQAVVDACVALKKAVEETCGQSASLGTDWVGRGEEVPTDTAEILVGSTNRLEAEGMRLNDWSISRRGNRVYLLGGSDEAVAEAAGFFAGNFLGAGGLLLPDDYEYRHTGAYALDALKLGGVNHDTIVLCAQSDTDAYAGQIAALLCEKLGTTVEITKNPEEADIVLTADKGFGVDAGHWGISCEAGRLYIVGRTEMEMKKAAAYFSEQLHAASGTLEYADGFVYSEYQRTAEDYYKMTQLVIYPEFPEQINRDYLYTVTVTQGAQSAGLPVYNHTMESSVGTRAVGGDRYRRFSAFAFSGEGVRVDIEVGCDFESYSVMPSAKNFRSEYKDGVISIYLDEPDYFLIRLDDDDNSILSVFADYPEFEDEIPDKNDPDVIWIEGWYEPENGLFDIKEDGKTLYIAPGAVLNARVDVRAENVRVMGRGAIVDPFEDIYNHSILDGGTEGKGRKMLTLAGSGCSADGIILMDARSFNVAVSADNVTVRNVKCMSTMMTTDGVSVYSGKNALVEHCFLYVGDNTMVFSATDTVYRDITTGTTCAVIFPQGNPENTLIEDVYVFRAGDGLLNHQYNPNASQLTASVTVRRLDAMDCIYLPHFMRAQKMGSAEKSFTFEDVSIPLPTGVSDPYKVGNHMTLSFPNSSANLYTENYTLSFRNFSVDGKPVTDISQIVISVSGTPKNSITFAADTDFKPVEHHSAKADYTAPDKVYIGDLLVIFETKPLREGGELLLAADEMKAALRTDKMAAAVNKNSVDYIRAGELVKSGMAAAAAEKDGALYITPNDNVGNLLLADTGEISRYVEYTCYNVDLIAEEDGDSIVYTCTTLKAANGGLTRFITDEVKMYGAGTYRLSFRAKSTPGCTLNVVNGTEYNKYYHTAALGGEWREYAVDMKFGEADMDSPIFTFFVNCQDTAPDSYSLSDIKLIKVD